ncbi:class I SAM-dependent methyltransferase [Tunturiibacter gelidoferens]|uniref:Class I SAM-dependent methyltransferase n=1 Tax=Tunturiibacter gelidiferens TaxID=3069689 RepID=A0AAU7YZT7_9BACT
MKVIRKIRWSIEHRGIIGTLTSATKSIGRKFRRLGVRATHHFDTQNGVVTDGLIPGHDLAVGHENDKFIAGYAAIPPSRFLGAMEKWKASRPKHAIERYTFIDFGCGKGRATLLASQLGFRNVVGIELNPKLANLATSNAAIWTAAGNTRCAIRIVCGDALELEWPDGPVLVYLYNPFGKQVMRRLVEKMKTKFSSNPGDLEVVYQKPEQAHSFDQGFELVWCEAIPMSEEDTNAELASDPKDETRAYRLSGW